MYLSFWQDIILNPVAKIKTNCKYGAFISISSLYLSYKLLNLKGIMESVEFIATSSEMRMVLGTPRFTAGS